MSKTLRKNILERQKAFAREIDDIVIFLERSLPILKGQQKSIAKAKGMKDITIAVPSKTKTKSASRKKEDVIKIYDRFCTTGLYETFLVTTVSMFEAFLSDVIHDLLAAEPRMIEKTTQGVAGTKEIPTEDLWKAVSRDDLIRNAIDRQTHKAMAANPTNMFGYISKLARIELPEATLLQYFEIKATRDTLVHHTGKASRLYIVRAGKHRRADQDGKLAVDKDYFDNSLALIKRLSGVIGGRIVKKLAETA